MPEQAKLQRKTGQRGLLIASYKRLKKRLTGPLLLRQRQSMSLHTWYRQGSHKPSSCATFMLNPHWGRATTGKKSLVYMHKGSLWLCLYFFWPCRLWPARLLCQGGGFSRQEYWCILASTGFHTLLEHYIFCCPSRQLPWAPGAARTPATQAGAPPPHLALTGANPSPPGQPQEQTPLSNPHIEVERKSQLKPRGSMDEEEDPKPFPQLYKLAD